MKDRAKFFVVALFLSLIFSVGAVCAQEDMSFEQSNVEVPLGTVDMNPDENNENLNLNQDQNEDNDVLKANNEPAVKQRNHTVDGNTFDDIQSVIRDAGDGDIIFLGGKNYTGTSQISITKSVTIVGGFSLGDGKYSTLNAQSQSNIFYSDKEDVTVYGIIFINGFSADKGGAMRYGTAVNCTFIGNSAYSGGAIYDGSAVNCTFIGNIAQKYGGAMLEGSAVNCTFIGNSANEGGALYYSSARNCTFIGNIAQEYGGAMGGFGSAFYCIFIDNIAQEYGGAMWVAGIASNSTFTNNSANYGGAVYLIGIGALINCTFENNHANDNGGAVYWKADEELVSEGALWNCSFTDNSAVCGSALYIAGPTDISNSSFFNNKANSTYLKLIVNLTGNNVTVQSVLTGGDNLLNGIYVEWGVVSLTNVSYLGFDGLMNTGDKSVNPVASADLSDNGTLVYMDSREAGQNITIEIYRNGIPYYGGTVLSNIYGAVNVALADLKPGNYTVKSYLRNNNYYTLINSSDTFFLPKIEDYDMVINSSQGKLCEIVAVSLPKDVGGNVTVTVGNNTFTQPVFEGNAVVNVTGLTPGVYEATVTYGGDDVYVSTNRTLSFTIDSVSTFIIAMNVFNVLATDYNAGERGNFIYAILFDEFGERLVNKTIQIAINGVIYNFKTNELGIAGIQINLASANTYTCAWFFQGDEVYNASLLASSKIVISKKPITISASNCVFKASAKTKTVTAKISTAPNPHDGKTYLAKNKLVTLTLNGRIYNGRTDENGVAKFNIQVTKKGTYSAVIKFAGDRTYEAASKTIKITLDDKGASSSQKSGVKAEVLGSSGKVSVIPTSNLDIDKNACVIDVAKEFTRVACDYGAGERGDYFYAVLKDSNGTLLVNKTVQIAVNGPIYNFTSDENGTVGIMVNLASANTYTYALAFSGDEDCNAAPLACSKLIVTKKPITIAAKDCSFKADAKTKIVTATLSTSKNPYDGKTYLSSGKKVTLKVNGNTYSGTIDASGKVTFNVKLTKKGTYNAVISFSGDQTYEAAEKTIKITIKG